jgi:uncharacterized protein (TIGR02246 family)
MHAQSPLAVCSTPPARGVLLGISIAATAPARAGDGAMDRKTGAARWRWLKGIGLALCALLVATGANAAHAGHANESGIRASLERLAYGWNTPDAEAWAKEYWADGELINVLGAIYITPAEIRDRTAEILVGPFRGSHFDFAIRRIRFIGTNAAVVDTDITVTGFHRLPGISPTKPNELVTRMKHIYERRHGIWRIVASQNTAVAPAPKQP